MSAGHTVHCPHGGRVFATATPSAARTVRVDGHPVATAAHTFAVSGCRPAGDGVPRPCVTVRWSPARDGVLVDGVPVLLEHTEAQCLSAASVPQGRLVVRSAPRGVSCR